MLVGESCLMPLEEEVQQECKLGLALRAGSHTARFRGSQGCLRSLWASASKPFPVQIFSASLTNLQPTALRQRAVV